MWTCKKCSSEVEDNFDICWNCSHDQLGTMTTYKKLKENPIKNQENTTIDQTKEIFILSHPDKIIKAGKSLKSAIRTVLALTIFFIVITAIIYAGGGTSLYFYAIFFAVICNLKIIFEIYNAGDELENSVTTIEKSAE